MHIIWVIGGIFLTGFMALLMVLHLLLTIGLWCSIKRSSPRGE